MKKLLFLSLLMLGLVFVTTPVMADSLVPDPNATDVNPNNPQWFSPTNPADEEAWLESLLGMNVDYISKDEDSNPLDDVPASWDYAVLKYGVGAPPEPDHWAIADDGDNILELAGIEGLPTTGLSHVTYFGGTPSVPEPTTLILLGLGLIGVAGIRRKIRS